MKSKILVASCALLFVFTSCVTRRACDRKFPPEVSTRDSIVEKTVIRYRDTTIYVTIPGEKLSAVIVPGKPLPKPQKKGNLKLGFENTDDGIKVNCEADSLERELKLRLTEIERLQKEIKEKQIVKTEIREVLPWWVYLILIMGVIFFLILLKHE